MTILMVGCGRMGGAGAHGLQGQDQIFAFDPLAALPAGVRRIEHADELPASADLTIFLAVKPQAFSEIAPALAPALARAPLIVSIMAGISIGTISDALGGSRRIARAMPNTAAAVGKGVSGVVADGAVGAADRLRVEHLLSALGEVIWLAREGDLDAVTAVSGSGPEYFFRRTEALSAAGVRAGLSGKAAMLLARATLVGAAALAGQDRRSLADLRQQVTSPGGTTEAGLARMDRSDGIDDLMAEVVSAAAARSIELGR
jgi:pyrroline-5-carboxylate reductase